MNKKYSDVRPRISNEIRRRIQVDCGHSCAIKGCFEHTYLEIHHIDGNRENNRLENLILLCDKHHKMSHKGIIDQKALLEYKKLLFYNVVSEVAPASDLCKTIKVNSLHVVDVYEKENCQVDEFRPTTIEIKFRNAGNQVAFLKEIRIKTVKHWEVLTDRHHSLVAVSARYDLSISQLSNSKTKIKVHHEIKPQETDRLELMLSTNYRSDPDGLSLFLLEIDALYNENSEKCLLPPIIVNIKSLFESAGSYFPHYSRATIELNKAVAEEITNLRRSNGVLIADYVIDALESWKNAPNPDEYFESLNESQGSL